MKKSSLKDNLKQIKNVYVYFIKHTFKHSPAYFRASVVNLLAEAVLPFVEVIFLPIIIDELMNGKRLGLIITYLAAMLVSNFLVNYIAERSELESDKYSNDLDNYFKELMAERTMDMDFALTEDKNALDQLEKAKEGIAYAGAGWTINSLKRICISIIQLAGALTLVIMTAPWTLLISLFNIVGTTLINGKNNRDEVLFYKKRASINRAYQYSCSEIANNRYGKDIRLYHAFDMMMGNTARYVKLISKYWLEQANRRTRVVIIDCACGAFTASMTYFYLGYLTMSQAITIGIFTQMLALTNTIGGAMTGITYGTQNVLKLSNYAIEYVKFMAYPPMLYKGMKEPAEQEHIIEFRDVSFAYPNTDNLILKHVNLTIKPGEHLSVVGLNGAGKTTFVKLLCRLYEVTEGEILLDGINIRDYNYESYLNMFAPVFQDFRLFAFSAKENVIAGSREGTDAEFDAVCQASDILERIEELPQGRETPVFKNYEEGGVELSGGEQQKLAIARAVYRNAPVLILDEPTAALDPLAEYEIYKKFNEITGNKTAVFISHRLSSCRFSDRIIVFSGGSIAEMGTHDALCTVSDGIYATMWNAQAKYYR